MEVQFPPLWTPTAKEVSEIAKAKAETIVDVFQAGLIDKAVSMRELKKLSDETGLFDGITDEEIAASVGQTFQDVTSLKDPLAGIPESGDSFELETTDQAVQDWKGQPREKGKYSFGKMPGGRKESLKKAEKSSTLKMSHKEYCRVSSGILTDHPGWKPGEIKRYEYGKYQYYIEVIGPGYYHFIDKRKLK